MTTRVRGGPSSALPLHGAVVEAIVEARRTAARETMLALITYATQDLESVLDEDAAPATTHMDMDEHPARTGERTPG